jgi:hypothetical protein
VEYFRNTASRLLAARDYLGAVHCLRAGAALAEADGKADLAVDLRYQLAEVYEKTSHPELAAEEVKQLLGRKLPDAQYGKGAMLRLKYLYAAGQHAAIPAEAAAYAADPRCSGYLPQVLYIHWITLRRLDRQEEAKRVQAKFLEAYPDNPLGADMLFANALAALAASDYEGAVRILDVIEARYPDSKLLQRVKEIRGRLDKAKPAEKAPPAEKPKAGAAQ